MFTKRTIRKAVPVTHVDTSVEALSVSMGEKAAVDLEYMEGLTGKSREKIISDLKGIILRCRNPVPGRLQRNIFPET